MVSVIVPVKNGENFLEHCLDSIVEQTYSNIEILVVDNDSKDASQDIIKKYCIRDSRVKLLMSQDGAATARNLGLEHSKGDFICFMDCDDFCEPTMVERLRQAIIDSEADISICKSYRYNNNLSTIRVMEYQATLAKSQKLVVKEKNEIADILFQTTVANPWGKMFKSALIKSNNLYFQNLHNSNDVLFVFSAMSMATKIAYINDSLLYYRTHHDSICQGKKDEYPTDCISAYRELYKFLLMHGYYTIFKNTYSVFVKDGYLWNINSLCSGLAKNELENAWQVFKKEICI